MLLLLQGTQAAREHRGAWCWVGGVHGWEDPEPSPKWIQAPAPSLPILLPRRYNGRRGLNALSAAPAAFTHQWSEMFRAAQGTKTIPGLSSAPAANLPQIQTSIFPPV